MRINYSTTRLLLFLTIVILLLTGCASKRHLKNAVKYDEAGLYEDAAQLYMRSLSANRDNIEAKLGLRRTGQMVLDQRVTDFATFHRNNQHGDAVYAYINAEKYRNQANSLGVRLDFAGNHQADFLTSRNIYLDGLYKDGQRALDAESFKTAEERFSEILNIDDTYKDARENWVIARYEPVYRDGLDFMYTGLYRKAYFAFHTILSEHGTYKDAMQLREEALAGATITVAVLPFYTTNNNQRSAAAELRANTISELSALPTPFYRIVNDPILNNLPQISVINDPGIVLALLKSAGVRLSADNILMARVVNYNEYTTNPKRTERPAYIKLTREITNSAGAKEKITEYVKTSYTEIERKSGATLRVEFSMVNLKTGMVVLTDYLNFEDHQEVLYGEYKNNYRNLIPGEWKSANRDDDSDKIFDNSRSISDLHQLFTAPKDLVSGKQMMTTLLGAAGHQISLRLNAYDPER
jgi:tetratricopeptide (TPR) repeat protein